MRRFAHEPLGRSPVRGVKGGLAGGMDGLGLSEVDLVRCHQADTGVMMLFVIPSEEPAAKRAGLFDGLIVSGEFRLVFQGLEMRFFDAGCRLVCAVGCGI